MVKQATPPFMVRVENPIKLPSRDDLQTSINGLKARLRTEIDPDTRYRLKVIKRELQWLRDHM